MYVMTVDDDDNDDDEDRKLVDATDDLTAAINFTFTFTV